MPFVRTIVKSPKTLYLKYTMLRGKHPHPVLGQNPYPLIRLYSRKKGYDKIQILFYKNSRFSKVLPMFSKKAKDLKIHLKSQGLISYLIILIFSFFRLYLRAQKHVHHSHSIVPIGFGVRSKRTLLIPSTS